MASASTRIRDVSPSTHNPEKREESRETDILQQAAKKRHLDDADVENGRRPQKRQRTKNVPETRSREARAMRRENLKDAQENQQHWDKKEGVEQQQIELIEPQDKKYYVIAMQGKNLKAIARGEPGQDGPFWEHPAQFRLTAFEGQGWNSRESMKQVLTKFQGYFEKHVAENPPEQGKLPPRGFVEVESSETEKLAVLQEQGWRPTQQTRHMSMAAKTQLFGKNTIQPTAENLRYNVRPATSFNEVRGLLADLHTLNARFNERFTLGKDGMAEFEKMYNREPGVWAVLQDKNSGEIKGLNALIGGKKSLEVEGFILSEDMRGMEKEIPPEKRNAAFFMRESMKLAQKKLQVGKDTQIMLYVTQENERAQKFYSHLGFEVHTKLLDLDLKEKPPVAEGVVSHE